MRVLYLRRFGCVYRLPKDPPTPAPKSLEDAKLIPMAVASFLSILTYSWINPLMVSVHMRSCALEYYRGGRPLPETEHADLSQMLRGESTAKLRAEESLRKYETDHRLARSLGCRGLFPVSGCDKLSCIVNAVVHGRRFTPRSSVAGCLTLLNTCTDCAYMGRSNCISRRPHLSSSFLLLTIRLT